MSGTDRALRRRELVREEARLKELEAQCDRLRLRIGELRNELREKSEPFRLPVGYPSARPTTSSGKIALFPWTRGHLPHALGQRQERYQWVRARLQGAPGSLCHDSLSA